MNDSTWPLTLDAYEVKIKICAIIYVGKKNSQGWQLNQNLDIFWKSQKWSGFHNVSFLQNGILIPNKLGGTPIKFKGERKIVYKDKVPKQENLVVR